MSRRKIQPRVWPNPRFDRDDQLEVDVTGKELAAKIRERVRLERKYLELVDRRNTLLRKEEIANGSVSLPSAIAEESAPSLSAVEESESLHSYFEFIAVHLKPNRIYKLTARTIEDMIVAHTQHRMVRM